MSRAALYGVSLWLEPVRNRRLLPGMASPSAGWRRLLTLRYSSQAGILPAVITVVAVISLIESSPAPAPSQSTIKDFVTRNGSQLQVWEHCFIDGMNT